MSAPPSTTAMSHPKVWPYDLGPDLSRGFRALKVWFTLETVGTERIGAAMERCCGVAKHLEHHLRRLTCFSVQARATSSRSDRHGLAGGWTCRRVADNAWRSQGHLRCHLNHRTTIRHADQLWWHISWPAPWTPARGRAINGPRVTAPSSAGTDALGSWVGDGGRDGGRRRGHKPLPNSLPGAADGAGSWVRERR